MKRMIMLAVTLLFLLTMAGCAVGVNSAVVQEDDFSMIIEAEKEIYSSDEPIKVRAILTYLGPKNKLKIYHAMDFFYFDIEQLDGDFRLIPVTPLPLKSTTLVKGEPVVRDFVKSGYHDESIRDEAFWKKFFEGPDLYLEPGTYKITATASFFTDEDDAEGSRIVLPASITITVQD